MTTPEQERNRDLDAGLDAFDAGLLSDYGGGDVSWWQDYIRSLLGSAHDFYEHQARARIQSDAAEIERLNLKLQQALNLRSAEVNFADAAEARATRAEARCAELEEGLRPFADVTINGQLPAALVDKYPLFCEALDRARALIQKTEEAGG